ncbi:thiosulfate sulfurtransferase/rhodanese-like domain-containing protein 2 [Brachionichthys hirsutus]|uniref:thiosulfate sulfurtransferase/rhodanese-like domain-containing protein 2 n=1 Tax=Brachionichthys hirsutus TaxID=412623 RepID=UPI003604EF3D
MDWEPEASPSRELKRKNLLSASQRRTFSLCRRKSFAAFVASKRDGGQRQGNAASFSCCGRTFEGHAAIHKHAAGTHDAEIQQLAGTAYEEEEEEEEAETQKLNDPEPEPEPVDVSAWIPDTGHISEEQLLKGPGKVLLYYHYCELEEPRLICAWQKALCEKLHLTGKVRVAAEGLNGTVGGTAVATGVYAEAMCSHPLLEMDKEEFKSSDGGAACFTELRVGVYKEIVPMGVDPELISYRLAGVRLEPEEFHKEVRALVAEGGLCGDTILLDCRNFYESKIGRFARCLAPNIRKFSYFPDYVDQNLELFRDKKVLMYCTGGVRCERGSAYLRAKGVCKEVYQLKGGIHKYLERFPNGFYRGKLFVFDGRYAISSNDDVIADCRYCCAPWDRYELCSTQFCRQLVLSCPGCRRDGRTACCPTCQTKGQAKGEASAADRRHKEECECTGGRPRIPQDAQRQSGRCQPGQEEVQ